jgi:hypothetical protein
MGNYYHDTNNYITKNHGIVSGANYSNIGMRYYGNTLPRSYDVFTGAVYYISGGLNAQNSVTGYEITYGGDYQNNADAWPDGSRTSGEFTYVACNNYNYNGSLQVNGMDSYYNATTNGGLLINCSIYSEMDLYHSRMCWVNDNTEVLKQFWGDVNKTQFLGAVHYRAPRGGITDYTSNEFRVWNSSGTLIVNQTDWAAGPSPTYGGFWYGTLVFTSTGWSFTRQGDTGANDGTYGIPTHTQSSLSFPEEFYMEISAKIYSSYCNSCTADSRVLMRYNTNRPQ